MVERPKTPFAVPNVQNYTLANHLVCAPMLQNKGLSYHVPAHRGIYPSNLRQEKKDQFITECVVIVTITDTVVMFPAKIVDSQSKLRE